MYNTYNYVYFVIIFTITLDKYLVFLLFIVISISGFSKPIVTISGFAPNTYSAGTTLTLSGSAIDETDGDITLTSTKWFAIYHHEEHFHDGPAFSRNNGTVYYNIPAHFDLTENVYYEIQLVAKNSLDETDTAKAFFYPNLTKFKLASTPSGLNFDFFGTLANAPSTVAGVVNTPWIINLINEVTLSGVAYTFKEASWGTNTGYLFNQPDSEVDLWVNYIPKTLTHISPEFKINVNQIAYPNPAKDFIHIDFEDLKSVEFFDFLGFKLKEVIFTNEINTLIDISDLDKNLYILKLNSENSTKTIKVLKN